MTEPQWEPTAAGIEAARITDFARFAGRPADYPALWRWSADEPAAFWGALWRYFELGEIPGAVLANSDMPGAQWFPGATLNYVDQIARQARTDRPAILCISEDAPDTELSWAELLGRTAAFAATLRGLGVGPATGSSAICPISPKRSSRSWRRPVSARSGVPAARTTRPRRRWTGSVSSNRRCW